MPVDSLSRGFYSEIGKRWLDLFFAFCGLILLSPVLVAVGLAVRLTSRGPAFFRQVRVGRHSRPFRIFKFRTMIEAPAHAGSLLTAAGDPRITPLGRWLRKSKFDELPQLLNVLAGDMSLVGPRPEVPTYVAAHAEIYKSILSAKPGITGPSANVYEEELLASHPDKETFYLTSVLPAKLKIDVAYCRDIRFSTDWRLIFRTLLTVFARILEICNPFSGNFKVENSGRESLNRKPLGS
jgi:lipopolysaccharide/colanic/teichoic acid biosynthesis glycosyltransferase